VRRALHLIKHPNATIEKLVEFVPGPDFPTGGIIVEPREHDLRGLCDRARRLPPARAVGKEDTGRGGYQIVVTEIPYQVQKSKLVEKIAESAAGERKLPLLADIRDESAETCVWSRAEEPERSIRPC
jgi:topoisomerase-4 subunit A